MATLKTKMAIFCAKKGASFAESKCVKKYDKKTKKFFVCQEKAIILCLNSQNR